ncbi:MAG: universal stress protein [Gemmatales bacterium]|nr:universal stress protein [Gemmatales bacterium]MDW7993985.1 universal stress protein [Gemmatales bacterium]
MALFRKILLPLDLTSRHQKALEIAANLAQQSGGEVTLVHVIELIPDLPREEQPDFYDHLEQEARRHLQQCAQQLAAKQVAWHIVILYGNRADEVITYASENAVDLIVLSSHKVDLDKPLTGWATLSYKISILAQCPVLLVK